MQNRKLLVGLACLTATSTWFADTAHADRRTGLGGNLLIQDADDVFPFPQYAVKHRNMIRLDYGANQNSGNGIITLGDEKSAFGISLHRGDILNPDIVGFNTELAYLAGVGNPFSRVGGGAFAGPGAAGAAAGSVLPATVFDVMYGRQLGDNAFGLRVGFGRGIQSQNIDGDVTKGQQTFAVIQGGYSLAPQQGLKLDLSGNVMFGHGSSTNAGDDVDSGTAIRAGFLGRGYYPINDIVDIGFLGNVSFDNQHVTNKTGPDDVGTNDFQFGLMGGIGPNIKLERAKIAAYGGFLSGVGKNDPNTDADDDHTKRLRFAVPMVNMAAEVQVLDWLYVRTGTQYAWDLNRGKAGDVKERASVGNFIWTAGLGVVKDTFNFDVVVRNGFVTDGPHFIGGNGGGFLAMASLTYRFGDVFSGAGQAPVQESAPVEPEPAPAPIYTPPPPAPAPAPEASTEGGVESAPASVGGSIGGSIGTN